MFRALWQGVRFVSTVIYYYTIPPPSEISILKASWLSGKDALSDLMSELAGVNLPRPERIFILYTFRNCGPYECYFDPGEQIILTGGTLPIERLIVSAEDDEGEDLTERIKSIAGPDGTWQGRRVNKDEKWQTFDAASIPLQKGKSKLTIVYADMTEENLLF